MKRPYYIFSSGKLARKDNTLSFTPFERQDSQPEDSNEKTFTADEEEQEYASKQRRVIPIDDIDSFMIFGEMNFNTAFFNFLTKHNISAHIFNYYGFYSGSYYPREFLQSGFLMVNQVEHYRSLKKRMVISRAFIDAASFNMLKNLRYYNARDIELTEQIEAIEHYRKGIAEAGDIQTLMGTEGNIRQCYYSAFPKILKDQFDFQKRVKHPPDNAVNALISFGNSMVYTACLSEIYRTQLSPLVSFLHEPGERRFSLALDMAEIFKPIFADRILFKMLNQKMIQHNDFDQALNFCYMKPSGRKTFVKEFEDKMTTTIEHRKLKRRVSYRRLIRLECYKLIKHIVGSEEYDPFKVWW